MSDTLYREFGRHLDEQAVGFPAASSGAHIRLLKGLYTPEQARTAMALDYRFRSIADIEKRSAASGFAGQELADRLKEMAARGLIGFRTQKGVAQYAIIPLIVGIYEAQVNWLSPDFLRDFHDYTSTLSFGLSFLNGGMQQMRTIPIEESLDSRQAVAPWDDVRKIIEAATGPFVINECICRKSRSLEGESCKVTSRLETCLAIDSMAEQCVEMGIGRTIDKKEALSILGENQKEGLVLQPSNTQKVEFICSCCGCCCGMLRIQKRLPVPVNFWAANFHAVVNDDACVGCRICLEKCQVDAIELNKKTDKVEIDAGRCIGCGNCVPACTSGALTLGRNINEAVPPETSDRLYDGLKNRKKRFWGNLRFAVKNLFFQ
ncbi:MAG: 4Fe-4S ferredoxin [Spirochaetae bacterium HGW-Spirochaetae-1]|jgi:ferredoxin|nr:MAG: 4Fe-4S ferredoxin [Spirochaetae bacterium HGW-Spirochaetae-1]